MVVAHAFLRHTLRTTTPIMQAEDKKLLEKFLYGTCTTQEKQRVQELLTLPGAEEILQELTLQEWNNPAQTDAQLDTLMGSWKEKLHSRIASAEDHTITVHELIPRKSLYMHRYAAVWIGLLVIGTLALLQLQKFSSSENITYIHYSNTKKIPVKYLLPDSSEVYLGSGSQMSYPTDFTGDTRELSLQGEAFFQVKHDGKKPFIIHTGEIHTQVLGTSFKVQAFKGQPTVVAVATGKVGVSRKTSKSSQTLALLTPGHTVTWNAKTGKATTGEVNLLSLQKWKVGDMVFEEQTMASIALELQRRYGVNIYFMDKQVAENEVSGTFPADKPIVKIMNILAAAGKFRYETSNQNKFKIYKTK